MTDLITISEVARRSGVAASALRFYEERGLIKSERAGSGHRRFQRAVLRRIAFIVFAQRIGLSLEEIGVELAKLPPNRAPTGTDWSRLSATWTARIDERIAELELRKRMLSGRIAAQRVELGQAFQCLRRPLHAFDKAKEAGAYLREHGLAIAMTLAPVLFLLRRPLSSGAGLAAGLMKKATRWWTLWKFGSKVFSAMPHAKQRRYAP